MIKKRDGILYIVTSFSVCKEANADQPFMCLDITYIWVLLEKGFGLLPNTNVYVSNIPYSTRK